MNAQPVRIILTYADVETMRRTHHARVGNIYDFGYYYAMRRIRSLLGPPRPVGA